MVGPRDVVIGPAPILARPQVRLLLVSATILFTELLLIRWIPANIRYIGFFPNFLLIASFLGIGIGILLGRRFVAPAASPFAALLFAVVVLVANAQLNVQINTGSEMVFGLYSNQQSAERELRCPSARRRPDDLAHGRRRAAAGSAAPGDAAPSGLRARHHRIAHRHRGIHCPLDARNAAGPLVRGPGLGSARTRVGAWADRLVRAEWRGDGRSSVTSRLHRRTLNNPNDIWSPYHRLTTNYASDPQGLLVNGIGHQVMWRIRRPASGADVRAGLPLVPRPNLRPSPDHRRRHGLGHRPGHPPRGRPHRRGRDRSRSSPGSGVSTTRTTRTTIRGSRSISPMGATSSGTRPNATTS